VSDVLVQHAKQILNDAGYVVIHSDRLVHLNVSRVFPRARLDNIHPEFLPQVLSHARTQALNGIAYEMEQAGAFVEHELQEADYGEAFVSRWEALVVLPKRDV
jgi:hypothetical protein